MYNLHRNSAWIFIRDLYHFYLHLKLNVLVEKNIVKGGRTNLNINTARVELRENGGEWRLFRVQTDRAWLVFNIICINNSYNRGI